MHLIFIGSIGNYLAYYERCEFFVNCLECVIILSYFKYYNFIKKQLNCASFQESEEIIMWTIFVLLTVVLWGFTDVLYKKGADKNDKLVPFKFSVTIGLIFFLITVVYLVSREKPYSIFESALRFWPMTLFGIAYPIINTISFIGRSAVCNDP